MSNFDETSGIVPCTTPWGRWWQTMDEVYIEVDADGLTGKQVKCLIKPKHISVAVKGETIIDGDLLDVIKADDSIWTVEDKKMLRICLPKSISTADKCWNSLLKDKYVADPFTFDQMEKKLTLQRFQYETETYWEGTP